MNVSLSPSHVQIIEELMKTGQFRSPEDVVVAALEHMRADAAAADDFAPGELAALVAEGEAAIERGEVVDGREAFRIVREEVRSYREQATPKTDAASR